MLLSADHRRTDLHCCMRVGRHHHFHQRWRGSLLWQPLPKLYVCYCHGFLELVHSCAVLSPEPLLGSPQITEAVAYRTKTWDCLCTRSSSMANWGTAWRG
jgi:hypothetical protein